MKSSPKKKKSLDNITKGPVTTVIGALILAASVVSVFTVAGITWMDASIGIGIGLALIFSPDTVLNKLTGLFKKHL